MQCDFTRWCNHPKLSPFPPVPIHPSIHPSIHLSMHLSTYPSCFQHQFYIINFFISLTLPPVHSPLLLHAATSTGVHKHTTALPPSLRHTHTHTHGLSHSMSH